MFKLGENVVFQLNSGFCLNGLRDTNLSQTSLKLTNLGNIYISKVDYLEGENSEYLFYNFSDIRRKLQCHFDGDNINVVTEELPFTRVYNGIESKEYLSLIMILDIDEFFDICSLTDEVIFEIEKGKFILNLDGKINLVSEVEKADNRLVFNTGRDRYEFSFNDIEYVKILDNKVSLKGYFYLDRSSSIIRTIDVLGNFEKKFLPLNIEEIVKNNKKIGFLPFNDKIAFSNVSGVINKKEYLLKNMYLIRHEDLLVFYEKKNKVEVLCKEIYNFSKIKIDRNNYIIYDGENIFNLYLNEKDISYLYFDEISNINEYSIAFTKELRPLFIEITENSINLLKSKTHKILEINKNEISDITIIDESVVGNGLYTYSEIKFSDKLVRINLNNQLLKNITSEIFSDYQNSLIKQITVDEVYENWVKSACDMTLFNLFSNIYELGNRYKYMKKERINLFQRIDFINDVYLDIQKELMELDIITVSMSKILMDVELKYFKTLENKVNLEFIDKLERLFFEIRNDIKLDFSSIISLLDFINYTILPQHMRKSYVRMLKENQVYQIEYFSDLVISKLENIIYNLLPHYISKVIKNIFDLYDENFDNYKNINKDDVKYELMERIKNIHVFKQFNLNNDVNITRKEIVDDLYSLTKFSTMRIDSELYYKGSII